MSDDRARVFLEFARFPVVRIVGEDCLTQTLAAIACAVYWIHPGVWWAAAAVVLVLGTGGFVLYNTNVLREYRTAWEAEAVEAEYERRYKRFEDAPRPRLTPRFA